MIRTVGEFRGRRREVQRIMALIGAQTPQSVSLVGERRAGKSTLLWHISQPDIYEQYLEGPERYVFMMMDFQGHQYLDQRGFCQRFACTYTFSRPSRSKAMIPSIPPSAVPPVCWKSDLVTP